MTAWKHNDETVLVWTIDENGRVDFRVEASTAEEAQLWDEVCQKAEKHREVELMAVPTQRDGSYMPFPKGPYDD